SIDDLVRQYNLPLGEGLIEHNRSRLHDNLRLPKSLSHLRQDRRNILYEEEFDLEEVAFTGAI
ncbi:hypothetical protein HAX54_039339, partial [Datura stramonium]|nr:hypothetical protein [Datura stramonium]